MSRRRRTPWGKVVLIAIILYVAGILVPAGALIFAVQRDLVLGAAESGNVVWLVIAIAAAIGIGLFLGVFAWIKRLAGRV